MYSFLVSLSILRPAVLLLEFVVDVTKPAIMDFGDIRVDFPGAPISAMRNAIIMAVVYIILGVLLVLQILMKPGYRLRGECYSFSPNLS